MIVLPSLRYIGISRLVKQIEEVKFLKENYFVRFKKVEAAKDQGP